ncbi:MAG: VWA domain-containing protein [Candidatus Binatia bacterium]|nr:VWA domain-containing protein [Candidatus Binatia bacterium]
MGILNPSALPLLTLLGILVLIYLRERWRKRIEVPSLLLWRAVKEDSLRVRRFLPDLLFFAQALLLLLLIGGLLHPYRPLVVTTLQGNRQILVFDVSASMQAREGRTRRFELALDQAKKVVQALGPLDEAMLISVSTKPQLVSGFTSDHRHLLHLLETLTPVDTGTNLGLGIELALAQRDREGRQAQIHVFTDLPQSALNLPATQLKDLVYHRVGRSDDNLAIAALRLYQNPFQHHSQARAYVLVRNYAYRTKSGQLLISLNDRQIFRRDFTLPAREVTSFSVKGFEGAGKLVAQLNTEDALDVDNQARAWVTERRQRRLVLVSPVQALHEELERVSRAIPGLLLTTMTPEAFTPSALDAQDIVLFHQFVPGAVVPANSLYVFPPPDNPLFPVLSEATDLTILDWREAHDILHNLHYVEAIPLKRARILALPSWAQVLISSRTQDGEVPLALTGEKDGHRVVCLAFDLGKGHLTNSDNLTLLLLFLNTLRWLLPPDPTVPVIVPTGETFFLPAGIAPDSIQATLPGGQTRSIEAGAVEIDQVGEYRIKGSHYNAVLYANLFDEAESDIGRREDGSSFSTSVAATPPPQELRHTVPQEFGRLLYYGAAGLLLLEWLYALWRYRRAGAP